MEKATRVTRRSALRKATQAASIYAVAGLSDWTCAAATSGREAKSEMAVDVLLNEPIGTINPGL